MIYGCWIILLAFSTVFSGFVGDTLVKTPKGYIQIAELQVDDEVFGINKDGVISTTTITHIVSYESKECVKVDIEDEEVIVARGQKFFLPLKYMWRKAKKIDEQDEVLAAFYKKLQVQKVQFLKESFIFYEIRLKQDHAFLVTKSDVIVHNCPLFMIGILLTCGSGTIAIETVWIGVCFFGFWLGSKMCGSSKGSKLFTEPKSYGCNYPVQAISGYTNDNSDFEPTVIPVNNQVLCKEAKGGCLIVPSQHVPKKSCGSATCKPPMPGPYGTHIPSPKHGPYPQGNIAAGLNMEEGQKALDVSVPVTNRSGNKKQRVSVWNGQYIVFEPTSEGVWHNHIRPWNTDKNGLQGLDSDMQKSLVKAGIVKNGKIIKNKK